jgi:cell surface protein SprA
MNKNNGDDKTKKTLPKNKNSFESEITILPDTTTVVTHGKKSKRIVVTARTRDGHSYKLKYKKIDNNRIRIINKVDSALHLKITVATKMPLENNKWYRTAQSIARVMMMVRNVSISYRNQYSMSLPGFMPNVGDAFGQNRGNGLLSPGLDFAFGLTGDSYVNKSFSLLILF